MPEEGYPVSPKPELLTFEEIARLVRVAAGLGMTKIRLTGGEPLVRKDLPELVRQVSAIASIRDISLTTNGFLLPRMASSLADVGLHRVNISLDTLREDTFFRIARRGDLQTVLDGIEAARNAGLSPIKINCVLMKGENDDEAVDFAEWTMREALNIRFIELMPIRWNMDDTLPVFQSAQAFVGNGVEQLITNGRLGSDQEGMLNDLEMRRRYVPAAIVKDRIEARFGPMEPADVVTNGPARSYRIPGALGTIGFITQISNDFCSNCNRLRLTADGFLRPCLMADGEVTLRDPMRAGATDDDLAAIFLSVVEHKPERHYLAEGQRVLSRGMSQLGG